MHRSPTVTQTVKCVKLGQPSVQAVPVLDIQDHGQALLTAQASLPPTLTQHSRLFIGFLISRVHQILIFRLFWNLTISREKSHTGTAHHKYCSDTPSSTFCLSRKGAPNYMVPELWVRVIGAIPFFWKLIYPIW